MLALMGIDCAFMYTTESEARSPGGSVKDAGLQKGQGDGNTEKEQQPFLRK